MANNNQKSIFHFFKRAYQAISLLFTKIIDWIRRSIRKFFSKKSYENTKLTQLISAAYENTKLTKLINAANDNNPSLVKKLLEEHKIDIKAHSTELLNATFSDSDYSNGAKATLEKKSQYEIFELLIQYGIILNPNTKRAWAIEIICYAAETNNLKLFKLYLAPPFVTRDQLIIRENFFLMHHKESRSFLHFAIQNKNYLMVDFLLEIGLDFGSLPYSQRDLDEIVALKRETKALLYNPLHINYGIPKPVADIVADYLVPDYAPSTYAPPTRRPTRR